MNKRGTYSKEYEMMQMIFYAFVMIFVCFIIIFSFSLFLASDVDTVVLDKSIAQYRLLSSPDCLVYDENDFQVRGVIDLDKFDKQHLDDCFHYPNGKVLGIKLKLNGFDGYSKVVELNKELTTKRLMCGVNENIVCVSERKYVLYEENDGFKRGYLEIVSVGEKN